MAALRENSSIAVNHAYGTVILVGCATPSTEASVCGGRGWKVDFRSTLRQKASLEKNTAGFKKRQEDSWAVRWANGVSTTLAVDGTPWASLAVYCSARVSDCWETQAIRSCLSVELVSVTPPVSLSSLSNVVKTPLVYFRASRKSWYTCFNTRSSVSTSSTTLSSGLTSDESVLKDSVRLLLALSLDEDLLRFESLGEQDLECLESSFLLLGDLECLLPHYLWLESWISSWTWLVK